MTDATKLENDSDFKCATRPETIPEAITLFTRQLKSFAKALSPTKKTLHTSWASHLKKMDSFIETNAQKKKEVDGKITFQLTDENATKFNHIVNEVNSYSLALRNYQ